MLGSFALLLSSFASIGPEKPHWGRGQLRYLLFITIYLMLFAPKYIYTEPCMSTPLFVGSYLQVTRWALQNEKEGKNVSNNNMQLNRRQNKLLCSIPPWKFC